MRIKTLLAVSIISGAVLAPASSYADQENQSSDSKKTYYEDLRENCYIDERLKVSTGCCLSSVDHLETNNLKAAVDGQCEEGYRPYSVLRCASSYHGCIEIKKQ